MISLIKITVLIVLLSTLSIADGIAYKQDGQYRMTSDKHLINTLKYKKNKHYQMLVEIPAGTRQKWEVNHKSGHIEWEFKNGKPREVNFLGYPGNYGFIPQTRSGDGDPLDIIVLSESTKRGTVLNFKIIGMLKLEDTGEEDTKILAIVTDGAFSNIDTLEGMLMKYPNSISIVKDWFVSYKGFGKMIFMGYGSKKETIQYIEDAHERWKKLKF